MGSFWVSLLVMLLVGPVVGKPDLPGSFQAGLAVFTDLLTTAGVLVVRGHISHPGVQSLLRGCRCGGWSLLPSLCSSEAVAENLVGATGVVQARPAG